MKLRALTRKCPSCSVPLEKDWQYVGVFTCAQCGGRFKADTAPQPRWLTGSIVVLVAGYLVIEWAQSTAAYKSDDKPIDIFGMPISIATLIDTGAIIILLLMLAAFVWAVIRHRRVLRPLADNEVV